MRATSHGISGISSSHGSYSSVMPSCRSREPYMNTVSSNSARRSAFSTFSVNLPSCMRVNSKSSSTMPVSRFASRRMISMPRRVSGSKLPEESSVSPQPEIAVSGVRSSWETDDMNSDCVFSDCPILTDMSLIVSASSPISSS